MIEALWKQNNLHLEDPKDQNSQFEKFMSKWMVKFLLLFHTIVKIVAKISLLFLALGGQSVVILMMVWPMTIWLPFWLGIEWCRMIFV